MIAELVDATQRFARRRNTRKLIATLQTQLDRAALLDAQLRKLDAEVELATSEHVEKCRLIQEEISEIENKLSDAITDRLPIPDGLESRRVELIGQISEANKSLEAVVERCKSLWKPLYEQARELKKCSGEIQVLKNKLARAPLANPDLLNEMHSTRCEMNVCEIRASHAKKQVERCNDNADLFKRQGATPEDLAAHQEDVSRCNYELKIATAAFEAAGKRMNDLHQQMVNE